MDSAYKMCGMTEEAGQEHGQECLCSFKTKPKAVVTVTSLSRHSPPAVMPHPAPRLLLDIRVGGLLG